MAGAQGRHHHGRRPDLTGSEPGFGVRSRVHVGIIGPASRGPKEFAMLWNNGGPGAVSFPLFRGGSGRAQRGRWGCRRHVPASALRRCTPDATSPPPRFLSGPPPLKRGGIRVQHCSARWRGRKETRPSIRPGRGPGLLRMRVKGVNSTNPSSRVGARQRAVSRGVSREPYRAPALSLSKGLP